MTRSIHPGKLCALTLGLLACSTAGAQEATVADAPAPAEQNAAATPEPAAASDDATAAATDTAAATSAAASVDDADELQEVIVTARRVEEKLQDVPISITVFKQDQLSQHNIVSATDLASITPSLSANDNFGNENASFAIRGFVQDAGTAPSVGTYFADVVAPRGPTQGTVAGDGLGPGSFFDLQNVQVLKGPQGTLFGRNTTGGAVLVVPQKPTSNLEGYAELSTGNYGMQRAQAAFNAPVGDSFRFRIAADHQERDGYLHNISGVGPRDYNDVNYTAARLSLVADLGANVENYTIASYSRSETNGSVQKLTACDPTFDPVHNLMGVFSCGQLAREKAKGAGFWDVEAAIPNPISQIEQWQLINTTSWVATDNLTVKNIASYAQFKDLQRSPLFGTNWQVTDLPAPLQAGFPLGIPASFVGIFAPPGGRTADQSTYTEEIQVQGAAFDNRLTYQAGVYLEWSDPLHPVGNQSPQLVRCDDLSALDCTDVLGVPAGHPAGSVNYTVGETTYRDQGVYTQATYAFTDQFRMTGGVRYTHDKQTNDATRITYIFPVEGAPPMNFCTDAASTPDGCRASFSKTSSAPTWMIDFDYNPVEDAMLYAKYARGYRAGGVFSNAPADLRTFDPEKVDNYEIGLKTSFDRFVRGTFNVAAFYNKFSDQQIQVGFNAAEGAAVSPTTGIVNAGKSRIYGVEVESTVVPAKGLNFQLSYTYLNATIRSIDTIATSDPNYEPEVTNLERGSPLVLSPKNKLSLSGSYTLPLDRSIGKVSLGLNYVYTDKQTTGNSYADPDTLARMGGKNLARLDSRNLLNGNVNWEQVAGSPVDMSFFVTNLTNEKYYLFVPGLGSNGLEFATLAEPRMYGVRLRYNFNQ